MVAQSFLHTDGRPAAIVGPFQCLLGTSGVVELRPSTWAERTPPGRPALVSGPVVAQDLRQSARRPAPSPGQTRLLLVSLGRHSSSPASRSCRRPNETGPGRTHIASRPAGGTHRAALSPAAKERPSSRELLQRPPGMGLIVQRDRHPPVVICHGRDSTLQRASRPQTTYGLRLPAAAQPCGKSHRNLAVDRPAKRWSRKCTRTSWWGEALTPGLATEPWNLSRNAGTCGLRSARRCMAAWPGPRQPIR